MEEKSRWQPSARPSKSQVNQLRTMNSTGRFPALSPRPLNSSSSSSVAPLANFSISFVSPTPPVSPLMSPRIPSPTPSTPIISTTTSTTSSCSSPPLTPSSPVTCSPAQSIPSSSCSPPLSPHSVSNPSCASSPLTSSGMSASTPLTLSPATTRLQTTNTQAVAAIQRLNAFKSSHSTQSLSMIRPASPPIEPAASTLDNSNSQEKADPRPDSPPQVLVSRWITSSTRSLSQYTPNNETSDAETETQHHHRSSVRLSLTLRTNRDTRHHSVSPPLQRKEEKHPQQQRPASVKEGLSDRLTERISHSTSQSTNQPTTNTNLLLPSHHGFFDDDPKEKKSLRLSLFKKFLPPVPWMDVKTVKDKVKTSPRADSDATDYIPIDLKIDELEISFTKTIGVGGTGAVKIGEYNGAVAAVKLVSTHYSEEEFLREVKTMSIIHHPNVIQLLGYCITPNQRMIVMPYYPLGDLSLCLKRKGTLLEDQRLTIALNICNGMSYLHSRNIIHRDLKPSNVLMTSDVNLVITDFGLSEQFQSPTDSMTPQYGTPGYSAPEMNSDHYTTAVDVFSFGVVFWQLYSHTIPFPDSKFGHEIMEKYVHGERPPFPSSCGKSVKELIEICWHQQPDRRPSFQDLKRSLTLLRQHLFFRLSSSSDKSRTPPVKKNVPIYLPPKKCFMDESAPVKKETPRRVSSAMVFKRAFENLALELHKWISKNDIDFDMSSADQLTALMAETYEINREDEPPGLVNLFSSLVKILMDLQKQISDKTVTNHHFDQVEVQLQRKVVELKHLRNHHAIEDQEGNLFWDFHFRNSWAVPIQKFWSVFLERFPDADMHIQSVLDLTSDGFISQVDFDIFLKLFGGFAACHETAGNIILQPWFNPNISRFVAKQCLIDKEDGSFSIRCSISQPGCFVIDMKCDSDVTSSLVIKRDGLWTIYGIKMNEVRTLEEMISQVSFLRYPVHCTVQSYQIPIADPLPQFSHAKFSYLLNFDPEHYA
eukprot:TRINITY_DN1410_c0_g1_i1.p1 TRINITY_DN1410_c0_g1~~TRINITY_DN1410_c0_g1_i1.p1  ORF type:complete len:989 (-),score=242.48 TRINITY_DN1410_c0_g1_i1:32-2998(-)